MRQKGVLWVAIPGDCAWESAGAQAGVKHGAGIGEAK